MPWINDEYQYTPFVLKSIAQWYDRVYEVLMIGDYKVTSPYVLIDFKVDFDRALDSIGRGSWDTLNSTDFNDYRYFGRFQRVVIADIIYTEVNKDGEVVTRKADNELEVRGFYEISQLRSNAYSRMAESLNRNPNE